MESYLKLLDFVDRPNPALTRDMRTSLTKSAITLSVKISWSYFYLTYLILGIIFE